MKATSANILIVISLLLSLFCKSQYQLVATYAGSSTAGFINGSTTASRFNYPYGVSFDGANTIYVADAFNHSIRSIDIVSGTVSTLAGTGFAGFSNGTGTSASFNAPTGVFYKNGFVYVADNLNNAIRKIDVSTLQVTTIAGSGASGLVNGLAANAEFYEPKSLVVDNNGDVFVADYENHVVRKISGGIVTTFAGTGVAGYLDGTAGTAQFWRPRDLTFDIYGNMYVADLMNNRIRKISAGQVTTLAGSGLQGGNNGIGLNATFDRPVGIECYNGDLYVLDGVGNRVRKVNLTGTVTTIAGSGNSGFINGACNVATFDLPQDLTLDNNGNIYIGDRNNNAIRIVQTTSNLVEGHVLKDLNSNCVADSGEYKMPNWIVKAEPGPFYGITDASGYYYLPLQAGTYTISLHVPNAYLWDTVCPSAMSYTTTLTGNTTVSNLDYAVHPIVDCPVLWVDVGAATLRRCMDNTYIVQYCNNGTDSVNNSYINIELDSLLSVSNSSIPVASQTGNVYQFNIGSLQPGQCGTFNFTAFLNCGALVGSTKCVEAAIGPVNPCSQQPSDSSWDHSSVMVEGTCNDSLVCFTITNTGDSLTGNMSGTSAFRIYENSVLVYTGTFQLTGGEDTVFCWPSNGNTIQLQADQRPGHPGNSHPNDIIEDCGTPGGSQPFLGFVNTVTPDDADEFIEIECLEVITSFDPNDKSVIPIGTGATHIIQNNDELEYKIRFQNTGNDTAFNITIIDTLSSFLDPATVISGVSSHPYVFKLSGNGILQWTFFNILLPDSNINEPASHGFVKFKVQQKPGNSSGSIIENRVGIIFDFNDPVMTNTTFNTIGENIILNILAKPETALVNVFPNPSTGIINFEFSEGAGRHRSIQLFDISGRLLKSTTPGNQKKNTTMDISDFGKGIYLYRITSEIGNVSTGKIIIQ